MTQNTAKHVDVAALRALRTRPKNLEKAVPYDGRQFGGKRYQRPRTPTPTDAEVEEARLEWLISGAEWERGRY